MGWNLGTTIFYGIAVLALLSGAFFCYKSERKQAGMTWIALLLILVNCYHTFWAAILNVIHIPVNIISMGIIDLLTGGLLWFFIVKKKKWQRYEFAIADAAFLVTAVAIIAIFAKVRYGGMALNINFLTIDPANHSRDRNRNQYVL